MKIASLALMLAVIPAITSSALAADEFIWVDRWNQMGWEFQTGYAVGIADGLNVLGPWYTIAPDVTPSMLSKMYGCANQFLTVRDGSKFAAQAMQSQGPKSMAAVVILRSLDTDDCQPVGAIEGTTGSAISGYVWKDRWDNWNRIDPRDPNSLKTQLEPNPTTLTIDGYVAGIIDLIRALGNAGKSPAVLKSDIQRAWSCLEKGKLDTVGKLLSYVRPAVRASRNPLDSTAIVIIERLRTCPAAH